METKNKHSILKIPLLLLVGVVLFSFGVSAVSAAGTSNNSTIYVSTQGNDTWDGLNATYNGTSGPKKTITNATGTVVANGTVHVAQGTYNETGIIITKNMTIIGENQDNTIINGKQTGTTIFTILPGINVTLINLTLTNSTSINYGGAIVNYGTLIINNCTFYNNTATEGGAICNYFDSNLTVNNSKFTDNIGKNDSGAIVSVGTLTVTNSTFTGNSAPIGGAIATTTSLIVTNSAFYNNTAQYGGAILEYGNLSVTNSTFMGNTATINGGAIVHYGVDASTVVLHFNRIVGNSPNTSQIHSEYIVMDATLNWWGSNLDPSVYVSKGTSGIVNVTSWLVLNITADPISILNGVNSTVTVDLLHDNTGTYHDPVNGHVPDGIPVTFTSTNGNLSTTSTTLINGQATILLTANRAGASNINATVDNQTVTQLLTVNPASYLYLNTTSSKSNPTAGETFMLTYKLSNNGPDNATNVTMSFQIPSGLEFVNASVDNGTWTYNPVNRTITWNLTNVAVGDPYLYLTVRALGTGSYTITPTITSETFNQNNDPLTPFSISVQAQNNSNGNTVNAASTTKTVPMQTTGMPIAGLVMAILAVLGGIFTPRKK